MIKSEDPLVVWLLYVPILVTCTKYFLVVTSPHLLLLKPFFGLIPILHVLVLKWLSNFVWSSLILLLVKSIFLLVTSEFFLHNSCFVEIPGNVLLPSLFMNRSILIWLVDLSLYRSKKHLHCMTPHDFIPYAHHGFYGGSPPKIGGKHSMIFAADFPNKHQCIDDFWWRKHNSHCHTCNFLKWLTIRSRFWLNIHLKVSWVIGLPPVIIHL